MKNSPHFNFLKKSSKEFLLVFTILIITNVGLGTISGIFMGLDQNFNRQINFYSQASMLSMILSFVMGIIFSLKMFSAAISIRGDRAGYLKAIAVWSVIIAVFMSVFGVTFEILIKNLIEAITHKEVVLVSDLQWIELRDYELKTTQITFLWFMQSVFSRFITNLSVTSLAYMIGAVIYRLKKKTNIIVFVIIPTVLITYFVNFAIKNEQVVMDMGVRIANTVVYLYQNPMLIVGIEILSLVVCCFIGTKLLIKAPTNDYAHDLI